MFMHTQSYEHLTQREKLERDVAAFLAKGGTIERVPMGVSGAQSEAVNILNKSQRARSGGKSMTVMPQRIGLDPPAPRARPSIPRSFTIRSSGL